jgi:hypothetical protein
MRACTYVACAFHFNHHKSDSTPFTTLASSHNRTLAEPNHGQTVAQWTVGNVLEWAEKIHLSAEAVDVLVNKQMAGKDLGEGFAHNCCC